MAFQLKLPPVSKFHCVLADPTSLIISQSQVLIMKSDTMFSIVLHSINMFLDKFKAREEDGVDHT